MIAKLLGPVRSFFAPPPPAPPVTEAVARSIYPRYRRRALESTFLGYAAFYLVRNNVPVVTKELHDALHYNESQVGDILAVTALTYGLSKFLMGSVSDQSDARKFIATGLFLTAICNFAFGATSNYYSHLILWALNGFAQGMGWPPCGRVMGHWFSESERGLTFSIWNTSHNLGAGLSGYFAAVAVDTYGGWQYAFYAPGAVALAGAFYLLWRVRDTPQSVGLPPIEQFRQDYPAQADPSLDLERQLGFRELLVEKVLLNKYIWLLAIANFFTYIVRYSMLDWGPTYLREIKHANIVKGGLAITAIEFAGIPGTIFFGWLSDILGGRRGLVAALCMVPIMAAFAGMVFAPVEWVWFDYLMLMAIGLFVYPALGLITVEALDIVSKKAIGTAAGFIGLFGYLGKAAQSKVVGWTLHEYGTLHGSAAAWNIVLISIVACAAVAGLLLALTWRLRPQA
jgi:OPA family glycerol-3-phosphate transporter-like MFS transporter